MSYHISYLMISHIIQHIISYIVSYCIVSYHIIYHFHSHLKICTFNIWVIPGAEEDFSPETAIFSDGTLFYRCVRKVTKSDSLLHHVHLSDRPAAWCSSFSHITIYYERYQNGMGEACGTYAGDERYIYGFRGGGPGGKTTI